MKLECDIVDSEFQDLLDLNGELDLVAEGFTFTEGPIWHQDKGYLTFNDIPTSITYRWHPEAGITILRTNTNKANGNTYDQSGWIIVCEHATSRVVRTDDDGQNAVALASHYEDKELNSPNDVIVSRNGMIWFTDPRFGRNASRVGVERQQELEFQGVFRFNPVTAELVLVADDLTSPNGLCFSPDESKFYVNDSPNDLIRVYDVLSGSEITNPRTFAITTGADEGHPDGLKVDSQGNVYCAAQGGIHIFNPEGQLLGRVRIPVQAANFCFGDRDLKSIYVTASQYLFRFRVNIPGTSAGVGKGDHRS